MTAASTTLADSDEPPGTHRQVLDPGVLGKGAMGVVYKAHDPHIRRTVALKVIRKEFMEDDGAATLIARFKNEAQASGRLSHPGVVAVYEYGEEYAVAYIAMEYVQGKGLREYFQRSIRFGLNDTVSIMTRLLEALAYAHEEGLVHRDSLSWLSICAKWIDTDVPSFALGWLPDQGSNQEPGLQSPGMTALGR